MEEYGLALSGGGAKGAYEIGVWKAIKEAGIKIKAVTGASVGAINGAVISQNDFEAAYSIWNEIKLSDVIKLENIDSDRAELRDYSTLKAMVRSIFKNGGLNVDPLKNMLQEFIDEDRIRNSDIDFGLVTISLTALKPLEIFIKDIPYGQLIDYLLASACLPVFKKQKIGAENFLDGGFYNNVPVNMLVEKGIKNIISVNLSSPGFIQKWDTEGINVINIKTSVNIVEMLDFSPNKSKRYIKAGYLDTLKALGKAAGKRYYVDFESIQRLHKNEEILKNIYKNVLPVDKEHERENVLGGANRKVLRTLKRNFPDMERKEDKVAYTALAALEISAGLFGIEKYKKYSAEELFTEILKRFLKIKEETKRLSFMDMAYLRKKSKDGKIADYVRRNLLLVIFEKLYSDEKKDELEIPILANLFTEEYIAAVTIGEGLKYIK